ncbi:CDP-diacylglycerol--glycerol-3-phosphate 3-phosphatidyltransferase [Thelotrema lepadinum]|nr:CDP-diacylglycerol--glycerol-3-phosphate 3-phosphatidyltransferase [Thelotrema lepadinum]
MLARRIAVRLARFHPLKHSKQWHIRHRQFSSSTTQAAKATSQWGTADSVVAGLSTELDRKAPRIDIDAEQVQVLEGPKEFYNTLKTKLRQAKRRIYLATLYVGKTETELIDCIRDALRERPDLQVSILTDALRGTREDPEPSCASLLSTLAAGFPQQVEVRMYHTPNLTGLRARMVPKRINEGWGLQHMKLYGVDDEVILSGANLSDDYFTNRQDRYHVFASRKVTDYFADIHRTMCSVSFLLQPGSRTGSFKLEWPSANASPSPLADPKGYNKAAASLFHGFIAPQQQLKPASNTSIYPLMIIPNALNNELPILQTLLNSPRPPSSSYLFTAGYFNPHPSIVASLFAASSGKTAANGTVLTASPWANGFYGSKGVSGMLPPAYTLLSRRFLRQARKQADGAVELREWRLGTVGRPHGWTYHAKGLWLTYGGSETPAPDVEPESPTGKLRAADGPSITVIGSSNYTIRSYSLDTEVGAVIVTTDKGLKARLKAEQENLLQHSKAVSEKDLEGGERRVGLHVRIAMWIVTAVGGSL